MATDFRFNGQQSYSPLLSALAEAPANRAKLQILQEQNQRERLSSLLDSMGNAAKLARQIQIQGATNQLAKNAGGSNTLSGNAALLNPEAYSGGIAAVAAPFQALDSMMGGGQPSQPQGNGMPDAGLAPSIQPKTDVNQGRKAAIANRIFPMGYELSTNPDTGYRELVSKIPGVQPIPIDNQGDSSNLKTDANTLNPVERKALPEFANKFAEDSKAEQEVLLNAKEFRNLASTKNPISDATLKVLAPRLTGIVARLNPTTLENFGGSSAVLERINAGIQKAKDGTLTDSDRGFFSDLANTVESSANEALKQKLGDAVSRAQVSVPGVHPSLIAKSIGGNIQDRVNKYKPMIKPAKVPAATRFSQLTKSGLSKEQAYTKMHGEGY